MMKDCRLDRDMTERHDVIGFPYLVMDDKEGLVAFTNRGYSENSRIYQRD
jgi:hypothetical protein